jgi:murein L,D-transpeptidase YcbB/YkuD
MPEFAEFEDKAHDYWIKKKKSDLALAKLELLREKLPSQTDPNDPAHTLTVEPDSVKWQAAAQELGLEVKTQDWFDAGASLQPGQATPQISFMRQVVQRHGDIAGAISKTDLSTDKSKAWVARVVASRDPNPDQLNPLEYQNAQQLTARAGRQKFFDSTFGSNDYMKQRFGLELEAWRREAAEPTPASK